MNSKPSSQQTFNIKNVFLSEFPEFAHEFGILSKSEDFTDMLTDYCICLSELQKTSNSHDNSEVYSQLKKEIKEEIFRFIFNHIEP